MPAFVNMYVVSPWVKILVTPLRVAATILYFCLKRVSNDDDDNDVADITGFEL